MWVSLGVLKISFRLISSNRFLYSVDYRMGRQSCRSNMLVNNVSGNALIGTMYVGCYHKRGSDSHCRRCQFAVLKNCVITCELLRTFAFGIAEAAE